MQPENFVNRRYDLLKSVVRVVGADEIVTHRLGAILNVMVCDITRRIVIQIGKDNMNKLTQNHICRLGYRSMDVVY